MLSEYYSVIYSNRKIYLKKLDTDLINILHLCT